MTTPVGNRGSQRRSRLRSGPGLQTWAHRSTFCSDTDILPFVAA